jgi:hypothetical protein
VSERLGALAVLGEPGTACELGTFLFILGITLLKD